MRTIELTLRLRIRGDWTDQELLILTTALLKGRLRPGESILAERVEETKPTNEVTVHL